jgi:3-oxoacyl-(acyl-carrier-protein) synthase
MEDVVITGIGLVTPLGRSPAEVLARIVAGEVAWQPSPLGDALACPSVARIGDFDAQQYYPENKTLRLMNRDAEMAVVAARLAVEDARVSLNRDYAAHEIGLFGATGLSGMPVEEIARLVEHAAAADGSLDLERFGRVALRRIRPVLSFKILANMPICFVSIFEGLCGPNSVYTPWEGQGAQAITAGIRAIRRGDVPCALVGGCDVKTHEFALVSLQQLGVFGSWTQHGRGTVPGEGAAFLVLEDQARAIQRSARIYARICHYASRSVRCERTGTGSEPVCENLGKTVPGEVPVPVLSQALTAGRLSEAVAEMLSGLQISRRPGMIAAGDGDVPVSDAERAALERSGIEPSLVLRPKAHLGNTFAAAAAVQVGLAAAKASQAGRQTVLANCLGFGTELGCFVLEAV